MAMPRPGSLHDRYLDHLRGIYGPDRDDFIIDAALSELLYQSTRPAPSRSPNPEVPMVLIEVRNPTGVVGRCDAKCYAATEPDCDCCCGGANHAKGLEQALANAPAIVAEQIPEKWIHSRGDQLPPGTYAIAQLPLWLHVAGAQEIANIAAQLHRRSDSTWTIGPAAPPKSPGTE